MPRGNGMGPMRMGPMTGRGAGYCAGFNTPGYVNSARNFAGFGGGRGFRRMFYATGVPGWARFARFHNDGVPSVDEKEVLNNQVELLENHLKQVKKCLTELD